MLVYSMKIRMTLVDKYQGNPHMNQVVIKRMYTHQKELQEERD